MNTGVEDDGGCLGQPCATGTREGREGSEGHANGCKIHGKVAKKTTTRCLQDKGDFASVGCWIHKCVKLWP